MPNNIINFIIITSSCITTTTTASFTATNLIPQTKSSSSLSPKHAHQQQLISQATNTICSTRSNPKSHTINKLPYRATMTTTGQPDLITHTLPHLFYKNKEYEYETGEHGGHGNCYSRFGDFNNPFPKQGDCVLNALGGPTQVFILSPSLLFPTSSANPPKKFLTVSVKSNDPQTYDPALLAWYGCPSLPHNHHHHTKDKIVVPVFLCQCEDDFSTLFYGLNNREYEQKFDNGLSSSLDDKDSQLVLVISPVIEILVMVTGYMRTSGNFTIEFSLSSPESSPTTTSNQTASLQPTTTQSPTQFPSLVPSSHPSSNPSTFQTSWCAAAAAIPHISLTTAQTTLSVDYNKDHLIGPIRVTKFNGIMETFQNVIDVAVRNDLPLPSSFSSYCNNNGIVYSRWFSVSLSDELFGLGDGLAVSVDGNVPVFMIATPPNGENCPTETLFAYCPTTTKFFPLTQHKDNLQFFVMLPTTTIDTATAQITIIFFTPKNLCSSSPVVQVVPINSTLPSLLNEITLDLSSIPVGSKIPPGFSCTTNPPPQIFFAPIVIELDIQTTMSLDMYTNDITTTFSTFMCDYNNNNCTTFLSPWQNSFNQVTVTSNSKMMLAINKPTVMTIRKTPPPTTPAPTLDTSHFCHVRHDGDVVHLSTTSTPVSRLYKGLTRSLFPNTCGDKTSTLMNIVIDIVLVTSNSSFSSATKNKNNNKKSTSLFDILLAFPEQSSYGVNYFQPYTVTMGVFNSGCGDDDVTTPRTTKSQHSCFTHQASHQNGNLMFQGIYLAGNPTKNRIVIWFDTLPMMFSDSTVTSPIRVTFTPSSTTKHHGSSAPPPLISSAPSPTNNSAIIIAACQAITTAQTIHFPMNGALLHVADSTTSSMPDYLSELLTPTFRNAITPFSDCTANPILPTGSKVYRFSRSSSSSSSSQKQQYYGLEIILWSWVFDTKLALVDCSSSGQQFPLVACSDDEYYDPIHCEYDCPVPFASIVDYTLSANKTYALIVSGFEGQTGSFEMYIKDDGTDTALSNNICTSPDATMEAFANSKLVQQSWTLKTLQFTPRGDDASCGWSNFNNFRFVIMVEIHDNVPKLLSTSFHSFVALENEYYFVEGFSLMIANCDDLTLPYNVGCWEVVESVNERDFKDIHVLAPGRYVVSIGYDGGYQHYGTVIDLMVAIGDVV
jgi:hypothetical protein